MVSEPEAAETAETDLVLLDGELVIPVQVVGDHRKIEAAALVLVWEVLCLSDKAELLQQLML